MEINRHGQIKMATIATPDLAGTERAYVDRLGYVIESRGEIDPAQARSWGTAGQAGRRYIVLGPRSGARVFIRLVEGAIPNGSEPRGTLGWSALDLAVRDADSLYNSLQWSEFTILTEPKAGEAGEQIYPMLVEGPAGEVLQLTEVRGDLPDIDLPRAGSLVDQVFLAVLASQNPETVLDFYRRHLGFEMGYSSEIPNPVINETFGFESDRRHRLVTTRVGRTANVEIDQYPDETPARSAASEMLPPGAAIVSFMVDSLDGRDLEWLTPPEVREEIPYDGRRVATCRGAAGELIELIEESPNA